MNLYSIPNLVCGIIALTLGALIYLKNRKSLLSITFAFLCLLTVWWQISWFLLANLQDKTHILTLVKTGYSGIIFLPVTFFHFSLEFNGMKKKRPLLALSYLACLGFLALLWFSDRFISGYYDFFWGHYPKAGVYHPLYLAFLLLIAIFCSLMYRATLRKKDLSAQKRHQAKYLLAALIIYVLAGLDFVVNYGYEFYPPGFISVIFSLGFIAYAIVRYRLMDIRLVFRKSLVYSLSAGLLTGIFVTLVLAMTKFLSGLSGLSGTDELKISIAFAFPIALLFIPVKNRIQAIVDRLFHKTTYDYYATIQRVSRELAARLDVRDIQRFIVDTVFTTLKLKGASVLSVAGRSYEAAYSRDIKALPDGDAPSGRQRIDTGSGLAASLKEIGPVIIGDNLTSSGPAGACDVNLELKNLNAEAAVPIVIDGKVDFILLLGEKLSGDIFSDEDLNLLTTIANQATIAIKNAALYAEKINTERLASIGTLAATLAHEIKNPLASIKVFTQLIPERYYDLEFRESFQKIVMGEIQRIDLLVTELLDFSKQTPLQFIRVEARQLLDDTLVLVSGHMEKDNVKILKNYEGNFNVSGDPKKLKQAFLNVFINSHQAMEGGGTLEVELSAHDGYAYVAIKDTGKGIPENIIPVIFDPFFTTKQRGAGLGLAISKKIIEGHGGRITVESAPGKGTKFILSLPLYGEREKETAYGNLSTAQQQG